MNIKDNKFLISLNEEEMSYEVLLVDYNSKQMFISSRWNSKDYNKFLYKAWFIDGILERKSTLYDSESDEEYYERLTSLKEMPLYDDHKDQLIDIFR